MLSDADDRERAVLGAIGYSPNDGLPPPRRQADAEAPARLGLVEFPALAARGHSGERRRRDLLDEPAAGHRLTQAAVRQPQPAVRARSGADLRQATCASIRNTTPQPSPRRSDSAKFRAGAIPGSAAPGPDMDFTRTVCGPGLAVAEALGAAGALARARAGTGCRPRSSDAGQPSKPNRRPRDRRPAALYFGDVMHARLKPIGHRFSYRVMSLLIDLDRLDRRRPAIAPVRRQPRRALQLPRGRSRTARRLVACALMCSAAPPRAASISPAAACCCSAIPACSASRSIRCRSISATAPTASWR